MKRVFPVLMVIMLCLGSLTFAIKMKPVMAGTPAPLSVIVTPPYAVLSGGQSQLFTATVTGGSPPYTYQWYVGQDQVSGAVNPTFNYTAYPYEPSPSSSDYGSVWVQVIDSAGTSGEGWASTWEPAYGSPVYYSVEPVPTAPLMNLNATINGLETPSLPSSVGENFTVEIHLRNATAINAPDGVGGVEVHFYFGNILNYCMPVGFKDELGQPSGAMVGPFVYVYDGFYDDNSNPITDPPYVNATQFMVAAGSETGPWNGNDGLVAKITFQITGRPTQKMSQPDFYAQLQIGLADLINWNGLEIPFSVIQGTLHIDSVRASSLVGDLNGDGKVSLQDLQLLANAYHSKPGDPNWNPYADVAPPYGIIGLTDLVTVALHYGERAQTSAITVGASLDSINLPSRDTVEVGGYFFAFYVGTDLHLYVNSSSDGVNWNVGQDVSGSSLCEPWAFGVFTDGVNIMCGFANGTHTMDPNGTTGWTVMGTQSSGTITWGAQMEIRQAIGWWYSGFTFAKTSAGDWWVGFQCSFDSVPPYYEVDVYNSTNGENWAQSFASTDFRLETSGYPGGVGICSWPQYPNGIMLVGSPFGADQYGYVTFDGSSWTPVSTFGSKIPSDYTRNGFSLVAGNGEVQFATVPATFTMGNQAYVGGAITYYSYNTSWSSPLVVDASTCFSPSLTAYNSTTLYLFYRNSAGLYYRSMDYSKGTWSAATSLVTGETIVNSYGPNSEEYPTGTRIGLMWLAGSQSPYDVRFISLAPGKP